MFLDEILKLKENETLEISYNKDRDTYNVTLIRMVEKRKIDFSRQIQKDSLFLPNKEQAFAWLLGYLRKVIDLRELQARNK